MVFISKNSIKSNWLGAEIDFALRENIEHKKLIIVPIKLDDADMPVPLMNLDYVDARFSIVTAADELVEKCGNDKNFIPSTNETLSLTMSDDSLKDLRIFNFAVQYAQESRSYDNGGRDFDSYLRDMKQMTLRLRPNYCLNMRTISMFQWIIFLAGLTIRMEQHIKIMLMLG